MRTAPSPRPARGWPVLCAALVAACAVFGAGRHGSGGAALAAPKGPLPTGPATPLSQLDVELVVRFAASAVAGERMSIAVVDRKGELLALWHRPGATDLEDEIALGLARTGAFFGNDQSPLTSRTVQFISHIHFPPGVKNQPNGDLYGIENTNRVDRQVTFNPGKEFPPPLNIEGTGPSLGIVTGKLDRVYTGEQPLIDALMNPDPKGVNPGGIPIYKMDPTERGRAVGGVGVAGVAPLEAEFAALQGSAAGGGGFQFKKRDPIFAGGIRLPTVVQTRRPRGSRPGTFPGTGSYRVPPRPGGLAPDGWLIGPTGSPTLSQAEVQSIIDNTVDVASRVRSTIRLPIGSRTRMVVAVGDLEGNILGCFRMPDSTIFSVDVAVAKARNVVYFSSAERQPGELPGLPVGTAVTNRSISFSAQPLFPAGKSRTEPGPFFDLFVFDTQNPGTQGFQPPNGRQNGIVFFPGSMPLYRDGQLVGGLGVSGDGVEQDDVVTFHGAEEYLAPAEIRADQFKIRDVRIPYLRFPRNPFK